MMSPLTISSLVILSLVLAAAFDWWWQRRVTDPMAGHLPEYAALAKGEQVPAPFCWRWFVPKMTGGNAETWRRWARIVIAFSFPFFTGLMIVWGLSAPHVVAGLFLWGFWPSLQQQPRKYCLPDPFAMLCILVAAVNFIGGHPYWGIAWSLLAGACRETAPLYLAAGLLNPLPLIGLLGIGWWNKPAKHARQPHLHGSPLALFRRHGIPKIVLGFPNDWLWKIGPAALALLSPKAWAPAALAVASMLITTDKIRILAQAAPFLLIGALTVTPAPLLPLLVYFGFACSNVWEM